MLEGVTIYTQHAEHKFKNIFTRYPLSSTIYLHPVSSTLYTSILYPASSAIHSISVSCIQYPICSDLYPVSVDPGTRFATVNF